MQVRSRKRTRRKKKAAQEANGDDNAEEENDDSENDEANAERTNKERKFDFHRFTSRFTPQGVVDTFVKFTKYYRDLTDAQLKRAHRYFYRVAFKQEMSVMLFRVDIIHLLHSMIKGPEPLDKSSSTFKEWEELVKQILRKCFKKIEQRPELIVEMLFSKLPGTAFFLEYGYEKQTTSTKQQAKPGAELVFKNTEEKDRQVAIVVGALLDKNQSDHIAWVKKILEEAESERRSWAAAEEAMASIEEPLEGGDEQQTEREPKSPPLFHVKPDDDDRRKEMFKNPHLRLLMRLSGLELLGPASEETPESSWIIPADVKAEALKDTLHYINQAEFSPPTFEEGIVAEDQLKRKTLQRKKAVFDDDEEGEPDDILFPVGGPTVRKVIDEKEKPKKTRKRRRRDSEVEEFDDSVLEEKARKRRDRELEKARKIKSALYVNEGDDDFDEEEDEAFFAREREIASRAAKAAKAAMGITPTAAPKKAKAKPLEISDDEDEDDDDLAFARKVMSSQEAVEEDTDETPVDGSDGEARKRRRLSEEAEEEDTEMSGMEKSGEKAGDEEDEDIAPVVTRRPRVRGGFVVDSDDDE